MYVSSVRDTLLVDGVDIKSMPGVVINGIDFFATGAKRGSNDTIPGRSGQLGAAKPLDAYTFTVHATVRPILSNGTSPATVDARRALMIANLRQLSRSIQGLNTGGQVLLTRRLTSGEGTYVDHTAFGEYVHTTALHLINYHNGRTDLEFINLDGAWHSTNNITITPGVSMIEGEYATRDMTITVPGAGTLTNLTANATLTVTAPAVLHVSNYRVTAPDGGFGGNIQDLRHSGDVAWFVLVPGENHIVWTGASGVVSIAYKSVHI